MELLADRDPEDARKLLDPVIEHMMEAVHRYEGTVKTQKEIPATYLMRPRLDRSATFIGKDRKPFPASRIAQPDVEGDQFPVRGLSLTPMQRGSEL